MVRKLVRNGRTLEACNSEPVRVSLAPSRLVQSSGRFAALAQPVEHVIRNDGVACSSHASGTTTPSSKSAYEMSLGPASYPRWRLARTASRDVVASIARDNKKPCRLIGRAHRLAPPSRLPVSIPLVRPHKQRRAPDIARRNQCDRHEQVTMDVTERNKDEVKQGTLIVLRIFARFRPLENLFRDALKTERRYCEVAGGAGG